MSFTEFLLHVLKPWAYEPWEWPFGIALLGAMSLVVLTVLVLVGVVR